MAEVALRKAPDIESHNKLMETVDYNDCLDVWYWNSATALLMLDVLKLGEWFSSSIPQNQYLVVIVSLLMIPMLVCLVYQRKQWIDKLVNKEMNHGRASQSEAQSPGTSNENNQLNSY
ncbi:MAG: hypothetical protein QME81_06035 [bacterium]|nr:hypothetical protein [bacterium]